MRFQIALTSDFRACDQLPLSSVQRARRLDCEKGKKKKEESVVKYKSADMYVGRPNETCTLPVMLILLIN